MPGSLYSRRLPSGYQLVLQYLRGLLFKQFVGFAADKR